MAMNKVAMAFNLFFIASLMVISMVESRTLSGVLEKTKPTKAEASSSVEKLNGGLPINLIPYGISSDTKASRIRNIKPTSSSKPIRTTDATPIMMKVDRAKPIRLTEYKPTWLIDDPNPPMIADDIIHVESTQVTEQPEGTATVATESTPISVASSIMRTSQTELVIDYTQSSVIEEIPNTIVDSTENVETTEVTDQSKGTRTSTGTEPTPTTVAKSMIRNLPTELVNLKNYSTPSSGHEEIPKTKTSSRIDSDSVVGNADILSGVVPRNLKVDDELSDAKALPTSSLKPIRTTDATPVSVASSMMRTSLKPLTNYNQSSELEENLETVEESTEYVKSTHVTNQPQGTATVETESTPRSDSDPTIISSSQPESMNYTQSSVIEETSKTNTASTENVKKVPREIGAHVFFGKMMSGAEMYNMTPDEYHNQIYPTHKCDVFLIGKLLKVADTPHNRMIFAKFANEETDSTSDDSTEQDVTIDN